MGIIIRQSIQNTAISYVGIGLGFVSTVLMFPNILSADQFGLTRVLLSLALVSAQFAHLGIKNVVTRFFPWFNQPKSGKKSLLTLALLVSTAGFALFSVIYLSAGDTVTEYYRDQSALFPEYWLFLLPLVFAVLYFEVLNSYLRALQDSVSGSIINEVFVRIGIILILALYGFGLISFSLFMGLFVVIYCLQPVSLLILLISRRELGFQRPFSGGLRRLAGRVGTYSLYSLLGGLSTQLLGSIDIIMLGALSGLASSGIYSIAFYIGSVITVPQRSIGKIATPILAGLLKEKKFDEIESLYKRTSINQLISGGLILAIIWVNLHHVIDLLPPEYQSAYQVVIIIGLAKLVDMAAGINGGIILNSRYYRFDLYTNIFLVIITVVTNYLLIPLYGVTGAAVATALSVFIYNLIKFLFVKIKFSMQPFTLKSLWTIVFGGTSVAIALALPEFSVITDLLLRSLIVIILFALPVWLFDLSPDLSRLADRLKKTIRK